MKKNFLMKALLTIETSFILLGSIVTLTHIKYCSSCGERYIDSDNDNVCDVCYGYKEGKIDSNRLWVETSVTSINEEKNLVSINYNGKLYQFKTDNIDYYKENNIAYVKFIDNEVSAIY